MINVSYEILLKKPPGACSTGNIKKPRISQRRNIPAFPADRPASPGYGEIVFFFWALASCGSLFCCSCGGVNLFYRDRKSEEFSGRKGSFLFSLTRKSIIRLRSPIINNARIIRIPEVIMGDQLNGPSSTTLPA